MSHSQIQFPSRPDFDPAAVPVIGRAARMNDGGIPF